MAVRTTGQLQLLFTAERENTIGIQLPESNNKKPKNLKIAHSFDSNFTAVLPF